MPKANGLHHLAIMTANIKGQIEFFSDVLGMELVALYWMHGVKGAWHGFLRLNDGASVAFVQTPDIGNIESKIGVTHAGNPGAPSAAGTMQHLALNVDSEVDLPALRDRIRLRGINVLGPIDHGFCKSIYFAGPEHLSLEIATSAEGIDPHAWIDPEVVALAGISPGELARYKSPAPDSGQGGAVAQPPYDTTKPHMAYPGWQYEQMLALSDNELARRMSQTEPPIKGRDVTPAAFARERTCE
jgi:catechol 2,3-dioxygenase-like lactoylglutathione lyase family enzyme